MSAEHRSSHVVWRMTKHSTTHRSFSELTCLPGEPWEWRQTLRKGLQTHLHQCRLPLHHQWYWPPHTLQRQRTMEVRTQRWDTFWKDLLDFAKRKKTNKKNILMQLLQSVQGALFPSMLSYIPDISPSTSGNCPGFVSWWLYHRIVSIQMRTYNIRSLGHASNQGRGLSRSRNNIKCSAGD